MAASPLSILTADEASSVADKSVRAPFVHNLSYRYFDSRMFLANRGQYSSFFCIRPQIIASSKPILSDR